MLVTLWVLNVYNHAQPALLYLVPGVLVGLWGTAYGRGEFWLMWNYTEDGSLEKQFETKNEGDEAKSAVGKSDGSLAREYVSRLSCPNSMSQ
jgi:minor histocompatibility antigen H13